MSDEFAAAEQAISTDSDDNVVMEAVTQVNSADDNDDVVEIESHYVEDRGRKRQRKSTRAALPA